MQICLRHKIAFHLTLHGCGTVAAEILELWGMEDTDRDVVLVCVPQSVRDDFIGEMTQRLELEKPGHGILFCVPLSSVATRKTLALLSGFAE